MNRDEMARAGTSPTWRRAAGTMAAALGAALVVAATPAAAQGLGGGNGGLNGYVSAGVGLLPDYDGARHHKLVPYLEGRLNKGNYYVAFEAAQLRFNLIDSAHFHAGPLLGYNRGRDHVHNRAVDRMADVDRSVTAGGFVEYEHIAKDPRYGEAVTLSVAHSFAGEDAGLTATVRASAHRPLKFVDPGLILAVELDGTYASRGYMRAYFDVDPADAAASGLPAFRAGSGIKQVGVAVALDQFLSRNWSIGVRGHYGRLLGDAADSPVTAIAGTPDQTFVGLVVGYVL